MSQQDGDTWKSTEAEHVTGQAATCGETQWGHVDMCDDATCQNGAATRATPFCATWANNQRTRVTNLEGTGGRTLK